MKLILVDGNGQDRPKSFENGFDVDKDLIRCFFGHVAATKGKFFPLSKFTFESCDILILMFSHAVDAGHLYKIAKLYKKSNTVVCCLYKDDWERFTRDINKKDFYDSFLNLVSMCDSLISCNSMHNALYKLYVDKPIFTLPIAHPMEALSKYITPIDDRNGIFVASYQCKRFLRQTIHAAKMAIKLGAEFSQPVTIVNPERNKVIDSFKIKKNVTVINEILPFTEWLQLFGEHALALNFDICGTSGQVQLDAAAVEVPCIGGNSHSTSVAHNYSGVNPFNYNKFYLLCRELLDSFLGDKDYYRGVVNEIKKSKWELDYKNLSLKIFKMYGELNEKSACNSRSNI